MTGEALVTTQAAHHAASPCYEDLTPLHSKVLALGVN